MGVSPNPDFLLAIPVAADTDPADNMPLKRLVTLSAKATGTAHPAVFAMATAGAPGSISKDGEGMTVLTVAVPTASGKTGSPRHRRQRSGDTVAARSTLGSGAATSAAREPPPPAC